MNIAWRLALRDLRRGGRGLLLLVLCLFLGTAALAGIGSLSIGAGAGLTVSYLIRIVVERAPPGMRERAAGLIAPSFYIAQFANPLIMQPLRVAVGIQAAFMLAGLALTAGAVWAAAVKP